MAEYQFWNIPLWLSSFYPWSPLHEGNEGTYSVKSPSEKYDRTQYGLGDFLIGDETNKSIQIVAVAGLALAAVYFLRGSK